MLKLDDILMIDALKQLRLFPKQIYLVSLHKLSFDHLQRNEFPRQFILRLVYLAEGALSQHSLKLVEFGIGFLALERLQLDQVLFGDLPLRQHYFFPVLFQGVSRCLWLRRGGVT
jgi:hypothetical protein